MKNELGKPVCAIILEQNLIRTIPKIVRAFQGWRYLSSKESPTDLQDKSSSNSSLPAEMVKELIVLGLL